MSAQLPDPPLFPFARDGGFTLPPAYAEARETEPVFPVRLWNGARAWLVTRFDDFQFVTRDPRFSGDFSHPHFPSVTAARAVVDKRERSFIGMDNPSHNHFRSMLQDEFSIARMQALKPAIQAMVDGILDDLVAHGPPVDLVSALANRLPALVMCEMFGSPCEDHERIMVWAAGRHGLTQTADQAMASADALVSYCADLIALKEREPGDDFISRMIDSHVRTGELSRGDFAEMNAMLLRAGHDTTANMISLGTLALLEHPDQLAALRADPKLIPGAVEEMLRYLSPVQFSPRRVALEDIQLGDVTIRKGDGVFALNPAANRDAAMFAEPERFDINRKITRHAAFGYGIHVCLGQVLARFELQIVFASLLDRFSALRLAVPVSEIPFKTDMQIFGAYSLPIAW